MNAGTLSIPIGSGRIQCTTAVPSGYAPNAVPFAGALVCVAPGIAPRSFMSGVGYGPNGRICIDLTGAAIAVFLAGFAITSGGLLACDTAAPITNYVHGLPVTAQGRLAISPPI